MSGKPQKDQTVKLPWEYYKDIKDEALARDRTIKEVLVEWIKWGAQYKWMKHHHELGKEVGEPASEPEEMPDWMKNREKPPLRKKEDEDDWKK